MEFNILIFFFLLLLYCKPVSIDGSIFSDGTAFYNVFNHLSIVRHLVPFLYI